MPFSRVLPDSWRARPKSKGQLGEARFLARIVELGLGIARPWGDNERYDFIVDARSRLHRTQIKTATIGHHGAYHVSTAHGADCKHSYTPADIDILAVLILPEDLWYIIPVADFAPRKTLRFFPRRPDEPFFPNREAWHLLTRP